MNITANEKPSPRDEYLREKERIQREIGDLEEIRISLGLSQRKLCKLLLVDPSAWTRWLKAPNGAPPHIYQSLRWLVELKRLNPDAAIPSDVSSRVDVIHSATQAKIKELEGNIASLERSLGSIVYSQPSNASSPADHQAIDALLRMQESFFEKEITDLKAKVAALVQAKSKPARKKQKQKKKAKKTVKIKRRKKKRKILSKPKKRGSRKKLPKRRRVTSKGRR